MQTKYSTHNIELIFWAWCVSPILHDSIIEIHNHRTFERSTIQADSAVHAERLFRELTKGVLLDELINLLTECGMNGEVSYIQLMQHGILE